MRHQLPRVLGLRLRDSDNPRYDPTRYESHGVVLPFLGELGRAMLEVGRRRGPSLET